MRTFAQRVTGTTSETWRRGPSPRALSEAPAEGIVPRAALFTTSSISTPKDYGWPSAPRSAAWCAEGGMRERVSDSQALALSSDPITRQSRS